MEEQQTVKISELDSALSVTSSDVLPIVQNGETKKVTADVLLSQIYDELYYKSGDTIRFDQVVVSGFVTGSTKTLVFTLTLPKSIENITSVSLNSNAHLLGRVPTGGYLDNNSSQIDYNTGDYTTTITLKKESNTLYINTTKTTVFENISNNMPVSIVLYDTIITFN